MDTGIDWFFAWNLPTTQLTLQVDTLDGTTITTVYYPQEGDILSALYYALSPQESTSMTALLFSLAMGCLPTMSASITATITDNNQEIVPNPTIEIRAWDGSLLEELNGDETGSFQVNLPPYQEFFVIASSEDHPPTSFTGYSGEGEYAVPNGTLWLRTFEEVDTVASEFTTCGL